MKKLIPLVAMACALVMMTACKSGNSYSITGTAQGHDGEKVYVYNTEADAIIDSTTIADGQFFFSGHTDTAMLVWVYTDDDFFGVNLLLQPNSKITIDANSTTLKGDQPSEQLNQFTSQLDSLRNARHQMGQLAVQTQSDSLYALYVSYAQQMKDYVDSVGWTLYEANADNKVGALILYNIADVFNKQAVVQLFQINNWNLEEYPKIVPGQINTPTLKEIALMLRAMEIDVAGDTELNNYLRSLMAMPQTDGQQNAVDDAKLDGTKDYSDDSAQKVFEQNDDIREAGEEAYL